LDFEIQDIINKIERIKDKARDMDNVLKDYQNIQLHLWNRINEDWEKQLEIWDELNPSKNQNANE